MAQPHRRIIGETLTQMTADLLRAPPLAKELGDQAAELLVGVQPAAMLACTSGGSASMSIEGPVLVPGYRVAP